jgi:hypothetical protein
MLPAAQLPAVPTHRFSLAEVLPNCLAAVRGERARWGLPPVRRAFVVLADGLGAVALEDRAGHARRMLAAATRSTIGAGFPSTTAASIATLTTGASPGRHGVVGYRALDPATDRVVGLLGRAPDGVDPATWQRLPTLFETADGVACFAVGPAKHRGSPFSAAVLRGAEYVAADGVAERFAEARRVARSVDRALVYVYVPELDVVAHRTGMGSDGWVEALETLDAAVAGFADTMARDEGAVLTADHGVLDIPESAQVVVDPGLLVGVRHVAGEPRCLQLHLEPGEDPALLADLWREREAGRAWVATRDEAIAAGWFGEVDPDVRPRIGDVLVAARRPVVYYADPNDRGRAMVGQHGSLTPAETAVPLLRFGAFAG